MYNHGPDGIVGHIWYWLGFVWIGEWIGDIAVLVNWANDSLIAVETLIGILATGRSVISNLFCSPEKKFCSTTSVVNERLSADSTVVTVVILAWFVERQPCSSFCCPRVQGEFRTTICSTWTCLLRYFAREVKYNHRSIYTVQQRRFGTTILPTV